MCGKCLIRAAGVVYLTQMGKLIYIADDEQNIRELIRTFLEKDGFEAADFASGEELLFAFDRMPSDLVILDIMMNGMDGLAVCAELRKKSVVPIIIVSAKDSEADRITGITIGGDDYLTKPFSPVELVARVKAVFRRMEFSKETVVYDADLSFGDLTISENYKKADCGGEDLELSPTEFSVVSYLARNADRAISRDELLKNVWKFETEIDTRATDDVIKRIRKKLAAAMSVVRIETVWGFGFKIEKGDVPV